MSINLDDKYPVPNGRFVPESKIGQLRTALSVAVLGQSFVVHTLSDAQHCYRVADELGIKVKRRKLSKGGWRVWKIS